MIPLEQKLQQAPGHLSEFFQHASQALEFLETEATLEATTAEYSIYRAGSEYLRPIRTDLFIKKAADFLSSAHDLSEKLSGLVGSQARAYGPLIDRVLYTTAQAHACVFDARLSEGAARKSTGEVFAELIRCVLRTAGVDTQALSLSLSGDGFSYHYPVDIIANRSRVTSTPAHLAESDFVAACMNTTKDRLARVFADKILLERYFGHPVRMAVIALHDVQRKGADSVTPTFLQNVFLLNWTYLAQLEGLYYLDVPPKAAGAAFQDKVRPFHELVLAFPA